MNDYTAPGDFPNAFTPFKVIRVRGADHLNHVISGRAHTVNITDTVGMVWIVEGQAQV